MMMVFKHDQVTSQVLDQALDLSEGRGEVHCQRQDRAGILVTREGASPSTTSFHDSAFDILSPIVVSI